jgi:regulatory protein
MGYGRLSLKGRALKYLAAREHSRVELERKLRPHEEEPGQVEAALDELEAKGLLSQARFVESLLHRKSARFGAARIRHELNAHQLDTDAVAQAVSQLQASEFERARALWQKKFATPATEPEQRAKQMRFLAGRGFSPEVIRRVVRGADDD